MIKDFIEQFTIKQAGRLNLFLPICFALGIAVYFALPFEPVVWVGAGFLVMGILGMIFIKSNVRLFFLALIFLSGGFLRINVQTLWVDAPVIDKKYHAVDVTGTVDKVEVLPKAQRLILTDLSMNKIPKNKKPVKIRLRVNNHRFIPKTGDVITVPATLAPPALPFYPDGYPYSRTAFYNQIGASGYATGELKILRHDSTEESLIDNIRVKIQNHITSVLPAEQAATVVALMTGNQSLVTRQQRENYTSAGVVHILSVSGFHMALIASFIFFLVRMIFLLFPKFSQVHNTRKICAVIAMIATSGYLLISGMAVPALRSFGMVMLALTGIICDRRAISLHSVFWIGFILLMIRPESLVSASFALSFCAVIALVACYEAFYQFLQNYFLQKPKWVRYTLFPLSVVLIINMVAHFATAPIAIYHFHRYANYGILGNLLIAPLFSFLIMPLSFCAMILMPMGIADPLLLVIGKLLWIADMVCERIAKFKYANVFLASLSDGGYVLFILGCLILFVLKGRIRYVGILLILTGVFSVMFFRPPDILISQGGQLWSFHQNQEIIFSSIKKLKSTRYAWMEAMGYNPFQKVKANDNPEQIIKGVHVRFDGDINAPADIVFKTQTNVQCPDKICVSRKQLWKEGTFAVYIDNHAVSVVSTAQKIKNRPWSQGFLIQEN